MNIPNFLIVFVASAFASIFGSLIGGASLVTIPTLMLIGLPPHTAIGTDRFGLMGIGLTGWYLFHKKGMMDYRVGVTTGIPVFVGSFIGANLVLQINESALRVIIIGISLLLLPVIMLSPKIGMERTKSVWGKRDYVVGVLLSFLTGIYGGFYGVLSATFLSYVLILWFGLTFLECAATIKIGSICMTSMAAFVFAYHKAVDYPMAIAVLLGCCTGTLIGVYYSGRIGNVWIKRCFILLVLIMLVKLIIGK